MFKEGDWTRAIDFLDQVVAAEEDYLDATQLLRNAIQEKSWLALAGWLGLFAGCWVEQSFP